METKTGPKTFQIQPTQNVTVFNETVDCSSPEDLESTADGAAIDRSLLPFERGSSWECEEARGSNSTLYPLLVNVTRTVEYYSVMMKHHFFGNLALLLRMSLMPKK